MKNPIDPHTAATDKAPKVFVMPNADIPDRWSEYFVFAHDFDGYAAYPDNLAELANQAMKDWVEQHVLPDNLNLLRSCLFYEARRSRFIDGYPSEADMGYMDALVEKIKSKGNLSF